MKTLLQLLRSIVRPIQHEDHLTVVEHLDELRSRIIVSLAFVALAFGVCFWQHNRILNLLAQPLHKTLRKQIAHCLGTQGQISCTDNALRSISSGVRQLIPVFHQVGASVSPSVGQKLTHISQQLAQAVHALPKDISAQPTTLGIGEPFTIVVTVCLWGALLFSLPFLLYQLYSYILPAFSPQERNVALPVLVTVPVLFAGGVLFGFEIVLPAAVHFLQGFDAGSFNQLVQANSYYSFSAIVMFAMGLIFQVPLFVVAIARAEIVSVRTLRKNRRYAIVLAALVGAALPGDAITMALETAPIVVLYEVGILVSALLARRDRRRERAAQRAGSTSAPPPPPPPPIASNDAL
jgi:sec-independent protein translocase protein TatC